MSVVFFILTVIYVAYVVYEVVEDNEQINKPEKAGAGSIDAEKPTIIAPPIAKSSKKLPVKPQEVVAKVKSDTAKEEPKKTAKPKLNRATAPKIELRTVQMKNPKTGEQAKVANNYRMVKRWIKEALVEEGLLEKIYKTNEMDDAAKAKVAEALSIIKAMDKYKV